jgi:hypothetical protein
VEIIGYCIRKKMKNNKNNITFVSIVLILFLIIISVSGCNNIIPIIPGPNLPPIPTGPSGGSIVIEDGEEFTKDCTPVLSIQSDNADYMSFSGDGESWSE